MVNAGDIGDWAVKKLHALKGECCMLCWKSQKNRMRLGEQQSNEKNLLVKVSA